MARTWAAVPVGAISNGQAFCEDGLARSNAIWNCEILSS